MRALLFDDSDTTVRRDDAITICATTIRDSESYNNYTPLLLTLQRHEKLFWLLLAHGETSRVFQVLNKTKKVEPPRNKRRLYRNALYY